MENKKGTSLHQLAKTIKEYWRVLLSKWWIIGLLSFAIGLYSYIKVKQVKAQYYAKQTFMVKESQEGGSMFNNLLGQFGLSGSRGKGDYNLDKLIEIANSKKMVYETLFSEVTIEGEKEVLLNRLIEAYDIDINWESDENTSNLTEFKNKRDYSRFENGNLGKAYPYIVGDGKSRGCMTVVYNDKSGIITLQTETPDEQLSMALTQTMYKRLSKYYIRQAREKQEKTLQKLELKADSLHKVLIGKELELAKMNDKGFGIILQQDKVKKARLNNEIFLLNTMYSEVIKNVENASFNLKNSTPVFQRLDSPSFPLRKAQFSTIKKTLTGLIFGGFLGIALVLGWYILREKWNEESKELNNNIGY